jgi:two-component system chemotaxis sensor kinase CheA
MMEEIDKHRLAFREESAELMSELESLLLDLERTPHDQELIGSIFRALHTVKGSSAMFGLDAVAGFMHEIETVFDLVRKERLTATRPLIDLTLAARDKISSMLAADEESSSASDTRVADLMNKFRRIADEARPVGGEVDALPMDEDSAEHLEEESPDDHYIIYRIRFTPPADILRRFADPLDLLTELQRLGECRIVAQVEKIPPLEDLDPTACHLSWDIILTTRHDPNRIRDVFIFYEGECELKIDVVDRSDRPSSDMEYKRIGEILVDRGDLTADDLLKVLDSRKKIGEVLIESNLVSGDRIQSALMEQQQVREARQRRLNSESNSSIRVPSDKLDRLVDLVGELVTVQARLSQSAAHHNDSRLQNIAEEVERLTEELRDNTMSIRMLPIGSTFNKFTRLVRDLSQELGKQVEISTEGADTELDKTVIERLNDPLVHIIRNAIDHGIETPSARRLAGKGETGTIHLSAAHSGGSVIIQIRDDGAGLDAASIRAKAMERGLITSDTELSEKELFSLILTQGLSTARNLTSVSGRGIGMDVVKKAIDNLRGSIDITSKRGVGTTITLRLPLTLAIIDGLLVSIGKQFFIFPLAAVEECIELTHDKDDRFHGRHLTAVRDSVVPYISLRKTFDVNGAPPPIEQIVIADMDGSKIGFVVDHVVGEHQTVIKALGQVYKHVRGVSGATILGDGTLALILDIRKLAHAVEQQEMREYLH